MHLLFVGLALASAALHAVWNTFVKAADDRLIVLATVSLGYVVAGAAILPFCEPPAPASWPFILATTAAYYGYLWLLHRTYLLGDISYTYPLSRGAAPLFVAIGAGVFGGEWLGVFGTAGVLTASLGIMSLAIFGRAAPRGRRFELHTVTLASSVVVAAMMVSNGIGARVSGSATGFIGWIFLLQAPVVAFAVIKRGDQFVRALQSEPWKNLGAGITAAAAYGLSIYAAAYAPMAGVSALRETSVIIAALLGTAVLGERPWLPRVCAAIVVAAGATLVAFKGLD